MQRNWDVVRKILFKLEEQPNAEAYLDAHAVNEYDAELVSYHMQIMDQAGLIKAKCIKGQTLNCVALSMTWHGHEFLDGIRRDTIWQKIKGSAREKGIDLSIDVIKTLTAIVIKGYIGDS